MVGVGFSVASSRSSGDFVRRFCAAFLCICVAALGLMSAGSAKALDSEAGARQAAICTKPLTQIQITMPVSLPSSLAAHLRNRFAGQCPSPALARQIAGALSRRLGEAGIDVQGLSYVLDEADSVLRLRLGGAVTGIIRLPDAPPPRLRFAEIIGTPEEGEALKLRFAVKGDTAPPRIEWLRDGQPIAGAIGPRLILTPQLVGGHISARLHIGDNATAQLLQTAKTTMVAPAMTPPLALAPRIAGRARVGHELQALFAYQPGKKAQGAARADYQWLRNGLPIKEATGRAYRLRARDIGARISVAITPRDKNGETGRAVRPVLAAMVAAPLSLAQTRPVPRPARDPREQAARDMTAIRRLVRDGDLAAARLQLEGFVTRNPGLLSGRLMLARVLIQTDRPREAEDLLQALAKDKTQSSVGRTTARRLLGKLQAVQAAAERREKQRRGETGLAMRQRFGLDQNVRRAAEDGEIRYYLGNLASLAGLNIDSVLAPTPGAIDETQDSHEDEFYSDTMINLSHGWKNRFGRGESLALSGMFSQRSYDTYDDNNDGTGDGDYQILMLRGGGSVPVNSYLLGGNLSFTQLALGGETASRTTELSGDLIVPLPRQDQKPGRAPDLAILSLAHQINNADPLGMSAANAARSGHGWRLSGSYRANRLGIDWQAKAALSAQSHNNAQLDFKNVNIGVQGARAYGDWQLSSALRFSKRVNDNAPKADDFDAIWGLQRRHDDTLSVQASIAYPLRFDWGEVLVSLDANRRKTDSNLERYDMQTGDIGLNAAYRW